MGSNRRDQQWEACSKIVYFCRVHGVEYQGGERCPDCESAAAVVVTTRTRDVTRSDVDSVKLAAIEC